MVKRLATSEIKKRLKALPGWAYDARTRSIKTEVRCKDFMAAIRLIGKIAKLAEKANHHPDLHLTHYRRLKIVLSTHEAGGVTGRDIKLVGKILGAVRNGRY